ncbi:hypothetical protein ABVK25_010076 [Lepraria finkii]|uniref:Uncharacterized protein n=1 Tax=Lepraria finkii TaxID=1340010 RepID=A0ABR4AVH7_9LECA
MLHHLLFVLPISTLIILSTALPPTPPIPSFFQLPPIPPPQSPTSNTTIPLPFRYPVPGVYNEYLTITSYTIPQPLPDLKTILNSIFNMTRHIRQDGPPSEIFSSIWAETRYIKFSFVCEPQHNIARETGLDILEGLWNIIRTLGVANLWDVKFEQQGFEVGKLNLTVVTGSGSRSFERIIPSL